MRVYWALKSTCTLIATRCLHYYKRVDFTQSLVLRARHDLLFAVPSDPLVWRVSLTQSIRQGSSKCPCAVTLIKAASLFIPFRLARTSNLTKAVLQKVSRTLKNLSSWAWPERLNLFLLFLLNLLELINLRNWSQSVYWQVAGSLSEGRQTEDVIAIAESWVLPIQVGILIWACNWLVAETIGCNDHSCISMRSLFLFDQVRLKFCRVSAWCAKRLFAQRLLGLLFMRKTLNHILNRVFKIILTLLGCKRVAVWVHQINLNLVFQTHFLKHFNRWNSNKNQTLSISFD